MTEQSKCPFCGSPESPKRAGSYICGTSEEPKWGTFRSAACTIIQGQNVHIESLEAANARLREALDLIWDEDNCGEFPISSIAQNLILECQTGSPSDWLERHDAEVKRELIGNLVNAGIAHAPDPHTAILERMKAELVALEGEG